jgi:hypothetical protein
MKLFNKEIFQSRSKKTGFHKVPIKNNNFEKYIWYEFKNKLLLEIEDITKDSDLYKMLIYIIRSINGVSGAGIMGLNEE